MIEHTCGSTNTEAEDESLFSGLIDGVLTQGDAQRVRLRLDSCEACRVFVEEVRTIRENAQTTRFVGPDEDSWDERPAGAASWLLRTVGWVLVIVWFLVNLGLMFRLEDLSDRSVRLLLTLSFVGWAALLSSVLIDRLRNRSETRYKGVVR